MHPEVVIFIGPPGGGKGTQADILAEESGFHHLESSKVIEAKFNAVPPGTDATMDHEHELWKTGKLNTPELVRAWMLERIRELAARKTSIVLSGSPRTLFEAEGEMPVFEELYGPEHVHILHLKVDAEVSVARNSKRRICEANRHPIPNLPSYEKLTTCPKDGSPLTTRALDDPSVIRVRLKEYAERTEPILEYLRTRGYTIIDIPGDNVIDAVHAHIAEALERRRLPIPQE
jgi:adenylate kinase